MGAFFQLDSHSMVYFMICEIHGFPHQFSKAWENAAKSIELGEPRKLVPVFSLTYEHFSPIRFPSYGILYHMENAWFFSSISNSTEKCSKIHPVSFLVVLHSIIFLLVPKSIDSLKEKIEKTDQVNSLFKKRESQFQARCESKI